MQGGRSSTALLLLGLMLAAGSTTSAAAAGHQAAADDGDGGSSYKLFTLLTNGHGRVKLAVRTDDMSVAGFANGKDEWFAVQGSEGLLGSFGRSRVGDIPAGHGLANLMGALVMLKNNGTK